MRAATAWALLVMAVVASACDTAPRSAPPAAPVAAGNPREEAAALAAKGDYAGAEKKYREALQREPNDLLLHFGLASVLSQLDRADEAAVEFRWVVANGRAGSPEVDTARRWLAGAGAADASASRLSPAEVPTGTLSGKLTWPGLPPEKEFGIRVVVEGAAGVRKFARTKMNGSYSIADLPEGSYKVLGLAGPTRVWSDVPVTVAPGRETVLDLTPANAALSPDDFPPRIR